MGLILPLVFATMKLMRTRSELLAAMMLEVVISGDVKRLNINYLARAVLGVPHPFIFHTYSLASSRVRKSAMKEELEEDLET